METTTNLKQEAHKYKWGARKFSLLALWSQYAPLVAVGFVVCLVVYLKLRV